MSELPDSKPRNQCRNGLAMYLALTILLSAGFGYSLCSWHSRTAFVELADQQTRERAAIERRHTAEKKYLRERLAESKATIISLAQQSAKNNASSTEATKAAVEIIKQNVEAKP